MLNMGNACLFIAFVKSMVEPATSHLSIKKIHLIYYIH